MSDFTGQASTDFSKLSALVGVDLNSIQQSFGTLQNGMKGLSGSFKAAQAGSGGLSGALKILKVAIAGTGIGLLIVAFGSLVAYFQSSEEGQDSLNKAMKVFGVIADNIADIVADVGEAIYKAVTNPKESIKKLGEFFESQVTNRFAAFGKYGKAIAKIFSSDWKEGLKDLANAQGQLLTGIKDPIDAIANGFDKATKKVKGFVDETKKEIGQAKELADLEAATNRLERELLVEREKTGAKVADLRLKARKEEEYTAQERKAFLEEANRLQSNLLDKDVVIAENRLKLRQIENTFARSTRENLEEEAQLQSNVYKIQATRLNQTRQIQRELNTLNNQILASDKALIKASSWSDSELTPMQSFFDKQVEATKKYVADINTALVPMQQNVVLQTQGMQQAFLDMNGIINGAVSDVTNGMATSLGVLLAGGSDMENFSTILLTSVGGVLTQLGKMAIATGIGILGIKKALMTLNPYVAIAAGTALVALGSAVSSSAKNLGSSMGGASTSGGFNDTIDTRVPTSGQSTAATQSIEIQGEFTMKAKDMVAVINKENTRSGLAR